MPWGDRTGPMGLGPMTGRAVGYYAGYPMPGYANTGTPGRGDRALGRGRGPGFRGRGRGLRGRGRGFHWGYAPYGYHPYYGYSPY